MRKILSRTAALVSAAVLSAVSVPFFTSAADDTHTLTVHYDLGCDDYKFGTGAEAADYEDRELTKRSFFLPGGALEREGYIFSGWTIDGFIGYTSGTTVTLDKELFNSEDEITVKAVWYNTADETAYNITYDLTFDGKEIEHPDWLLDRKRAPGLLFKPNYTRIDLENAVSRGYMTDDGVFLSFGTKIVTQDHDVVLHCVWAHNVQFIYKAGDVDRINGNTEHSFKCMEGGSSELQKEDRFSRNGFNLVGWLSDYDGEVHKPGTTVPVPGVDVTFTAVWEPKTYNVLFKPGNGGENIKVPGKTDTEIVCPDPGITVEGRVFTGWKELNTGNIYQAGENYLIRGTIPGAGIAFSAVWADEPDPNEVLPEVTLYGDANNDGYVGIADATCILQAIGNPDLYKLSLQGKANADCYEPGSGVTGLDAMAIQKLDAKLLESLPEYAEK